MVCLDDVLIFSTSLKEHIKAISDIFKVIEKNGLKIQIDKCRFMEKETPFLGHIITADGLKPNPDKIKIIEKNKTSENRKRNKKFPGINRFLPKIHQGLC